MVNEQLSKQLKISIGDIGISLTANNRFNIDNAYRPFLSRGCPEVMLRTHYGDIPQIELGKKIFNSQLWDLHRSSEKVILRIHQPEARLTSVTKIGVFLLDFGSGDIYVGMEKFQIDFPLNYPLGQILMINLLSQGRGVLTHSCGVGNNGKGMLFAGSSGAGKSTLANLWKDKKDVTVLSDDRIIIRKIDGGFWIYGTPWHGDAKACSPEKSPLEKIFFLKHAKKNEIKKMSPIDATSRMVVCSFPTFWDKKGMEFTLGFIDELTREVPCYELGFVPDERVLDLVKSI